jgi:hypothetical protein
MCSYPMCHNRSKQDNGGAIYSYYCNMNIHNAIFANNTADVRYTQWFHDNRFFAIFETDSNLTIPYKIKKIACVRIQRVTIVQNRITVVQFIHIMAI